MKIRLVGAELFNMGKTNRKTDVTELMVALCNFAKAPEAFVSSKLCTCCDVFQWHLSQCASLFTSYLPIITTSKLVADQQ